MAQIPATRKKLREARFFLEKLRDEVKSIPRDPEVFEFYLSAFLSAGRSVTFVLQAEEKDKYDTWYRSWVQALPPEDRQVLALMNEQRVAALHKRGAETNVKLQNLTLARVPTGSRAHPAYGFHWRAPFGTDPPTVEQVIHEFVIGGSPVDVVSVCARYVELLDLLVQSFSDAIARDNRCAQSHPSRVALYSEHPGS